MKTYLNTFIEDNSNKENCSFFSNDQRQLFDNSNQKSFNSYHSDIDSDLKEKQLRLNGEKKKINLKAIIGGLLRLRKQHERKESIIQINQEHLCFKIFKSWRKLTKYAVNRKNEAEMMEESKKYDLIRKCFKQWRQIMRKPKIELLQRKREIFNAFKITCSIDLSLRVRKIRVMEFLHRKRGHLFFSILTHEYRVMIFQMQKAEQFYQRKKQSLFFKSIYDYTKNEEKGRLKYQKYELASLFKKKVLLQKSFQILKDQL